MRSTAKRLCLRPLLHPQKQPPVDLLVEVGAAEVAVQPLEPLALLHPRRWLLFR
jgi:hypothetical protein